MYQNHSNIKCIHPVTQFKVKYSTVLCADITTVKSRYGIFVYCIVKIIVIISPEGKLAGLSLVSMASTVINTILL